MCETWNGRSCTICNSANEAQESQDIDELNGPEENTEKLKIVDEQQLCYCLYGSDKGKYQRLIQI